MGRCTARGIKINAEDQRQEMINEWRSDRFLRARCARFAFIRLSPAPPLSFSLVLSTPPSKVDGVAGDGRGKEKRLARKRGETNGSFNIAAKSTKPSVADGARFFTAINSDCGS